MRQQVRLLSVVAVGLFTGCSAEEAAAPVAPPDVGTIVGEVFADEGAGPVSIDGALIEVFGMSVRTRSVAGNKFVLTPVPLGTHEILITDELGGRSARTTATVAGPFQTVELSTTATSLTPPATLTGSVSASGGSAAGTIVYLVGGNSLQITFAGDDGSYSLNNLPPGERLIGYSLTGYDVVTQSVNVAAGSNSAGDVTLASPSSAGGLVIAGRINLAEETNHAGVIVVLDGRDIATTDSAGSFSFNTATPGVHALRAQRSGYKSIDLPTVTVTAAGAVSGMPTQLFMSPGQDSDDRPQIDTANLSLVMAQPAVAGAEVFDNIGTTLIAELSGSPVALPDNAFVWSYSIGGGAFTDFTTRGPTVSVQFPTPTGTSDCSVTRPKDPRPGDPIIVLEGRQLSLRVAVGLDGATLSQERSLCLVPFSFAPQVRLGALDLDLITGPEVVSLGINGSYSVAPASSGGGVVVTMVETQPVTLGASAVHPLEGDLTSDIEWLSDTNFSYVGGSADLSLLPAGSHDFTVVVTDSQGRLAERRVLVDIAPFTFSATICAPRLTAEDPCDPSGTDPQSALDAPPYYQGLGLPLRVRINHGYQAFFSPLAASWSTPELGVIAQGTSLTTFVALPSVGTMRVQVQDATGRLVTTSDDFAQQVLSFTAAFSQPALGTNVLEGTALTFAVSYSHSLVPSEISESELSVRYFSSFQGVLDVAGQLDFPVTATPQFTLVAGQHTITARVRDGSGATAETTRAVQVRSPGVSALLLTPNTNNVVLFPGQVLDFDTLTNHDPSVTPEYRWYLDGVEFDASWGAPTYGSLALTNSARADLNLGTYAAASPPWNDGRWAEGPHVLEMHMKLPGVTGPGNCYDIPDRAVCLQLTVQTAASAVTQATQTITTAVVWSGLIQLTGTVTIDGPSASLTLLPGTRVIANTGSPGTVRFRIIEGSLTIGSNASAQRTVLEAQGVGAVAGAWGGIYIYPNASENVAINIENTTFRHTTSALYAESSNYGSGDSTMVDNVLFEDVARAWYRFCPSHDDITIRRATTAAFDEDGSYGCPLTRSYENIDIEDSREGIILYASSGQYPTITIDGVTLTDIETTGINAYGVYNTGASLTVRNTIATNVGYGSSTGRAIYMRYCLDFALFDSELSGPNNGVISDGSCGVLTTSGYLMRIGRNVFDGFFKAIYVDTLTLPDLLVQGNSFTNVGNVMEWRTGASPNNGEAHFVGNFMGATTGTPGFVAGNAAPGADAGNLPKIVDNRDTASVDAIVRVDNVLPSAFSSANAAPLAVMTEPRRSRRYHTNNSGCIPLQAAAIGSTFDVAGSCRFGLFDPPATSASPTWLEGVGDIDAEGCLDTSAHPLAPGVHGVVLECTDDLTSRTTRHETQFLVDNTNVVGLVYRANEIWDEDMTVIGDLTVPAGKQLTLSPGLTLSFANSDLLREVRPFIDNETVNNLIESRNSVELRVAGSLVSVGTGGEPIVLESEGVLPVKGAWAGIRARHPSTVTMAHTEIYSANIVLWAEYNSADYSNHPLIDMSDVHVETTHGIIRGICPGIFERIVGRDINRVIGGAYCYDDLVIEDGDFVGIGDTSTDYYVVQPWTNPSNATPIGVFINNSIFDRQRGTRVGRAVAPDQGSGNRISAVVITNTTFEDFEYVLAHGGTEAISYTASIADSHLENVRYAVLNARFATLSMDHNIFNNGQSLYYQGVASTTFTQAFEFTRNRLSNYVNPFIDLIFASNVATVSVTGNDFSNVTGTVLEVDVYTSPSPRTDNVTFSGNSFETCAKVFSSSDPDLTSANFTLLVDLTNSWFGTTTEATIRGLITHNEPDAGAGYVGNTNYAGFLSNKPVLDTP